MSPRHPRARRRRRDAVEALGEDWSERPDVCLGLTVRLDDLAAINLYRRQGFEPWLVLARYGLLL